MELAHFVEPDVWLRPGLQIARPLRRFDRPDRVRRAARARCQQHRRLRRLHQPVPERRLLQRRSSRTVARRAASSTCG